MIGKVARYTDDLITYGIGVDKSKPTFVNLSVTNKCNARCVMCDIWKYESNDLSVEELSKCLDNEYLSDVREFGITGGEPFLRRDFIRLVDLIQNKMPNVKFIGVTSNGFMTSRIRRMMPVILSRLKKGVVFQITVSIDGVDAVHNESRGVPKVFDKVEKTVEILRSFRDEYDNFKLYFACTVTSSNARHRHLEDLQKYASSKQVGIIYRLGVLVDRIYNEQLMVKSGVRPGSPDSLEVISFLNSLLEQGAGFRSAYYKMMVDYLSLVVDQRTLKCKEQRDGVMLDSNGDVYVCSVSGKKVGNLLEHTSGYLISNAKKMRACVRGQTCDGCYHDHMSHIPLKDVAVSVFSKLFNV